VSKKGRSEQKVRGGRAASLTGGDFKGDHYSRIRTNDWTRGWPADEKKKSFNYSFPEREGPKTKSGEGVQRFARKKLESEGGSQQSPLNRRRAAAIRIEILKETARGEKADWGGCLEAPDPNAGPG